MSKTKRLLSMLLVVALVAGIAISGTLAYLTSTDSDVNVMTLGNVQIEQIEQERDADGNFVDFTQEKPAFPAVGPIEWAEDGVDVNGAEYKVFTDELKNVIDKIVTVKNTGKSDAYVRTIVAIEAPDYDPNDLIHVNVNGNISNTSWTPVDIDNEKYVYSVFTYADPLAPNTISAPSLLQVFLDSAATNEDCAKFGETWEIRVLSQAVQTAGFGSATTALDTGFGEANKENVAEWFAGMGAADTWDGTSDTSWYNETDSEFVITTAEQLAGFRDMVNAGNNFDGKTFVIANNIDLANNNWIPIGGIDASYDFKGEFDGNGHTISNLSIQFGEKGADKVRGGLFASPAEAYIHDFTLTGVEISGTGSDIRAGALAGNVWTGTIVENVIVDDVVMNINGGSYLGGVAGRVYFAQMNNVDASNIEITNNNADGVYIGGYTSHAAGHTASGGAYNWVDADGNRVVNSLFDDCDIDGVVINAKTEAEAAYIGGFVSSNQYNNSENFYENCNITGLDINCEGYSFVVGGFIGESYGQSTTAPNGKQYSFDGCSVQGTINGTNGTYGGFIGIMLGRAKAYAGASADVDIVCTGTAGGFVGKTAHTHQNNANNTQKVSFTDCHATGDVTANIAGGFVGNITIGSDASRRIEFTATDCSASGKANGTTAGGGFAGQIDGSRVSVADSYVTFENCSVAGGAELYGKFIDNANYPTTITVNN